MTKMVIPLGAKEASIRAKVIRADGRVEELGVIAFYSRSRWKRWLFKLRRATRWLLCR